MEKRNKDIRTTSAWAECLFF